MSDGDPGQDVGPTLVLDEAAPRTELEHELLLCELEAQFDKRWRRTSVNKLNWPPGSTTGFLKANLYCSLASFGRDGLDIHAHKSR